MGNFHFLCSESFPQISHVSGGSDYVSIEKITSGAIFYHVTFIFYDVSIINILSETVLVFFAIKNYELPLLFPRKTQKTC